MIFMTVEFWAINDKNIFFPSNKSQFLYSVGFSVLKIGTEWYTYSRSIRTIPISSVDNLSNVLILKKNCPLDILLIQLYLSKVKRSFYLRSCKSLPEFSFVLLVNFCAEPFNISFFIACPILIIFAYKSKIALYQDLTRAIDKLSNLKITIYNVFEID